MRHSARKGFLVGVLLKHRDIRVAFLAISGRANIASRLEERSSYKMKVSMNSKPAISIFRAHACSVLPCAGSTAVVCKPRVTCVPSSYVARAVETKLHALRCSECSALHQLIA
eukprot:2741123-Amphidinium_carterae.2